MKKRFVLFVACLFLFPSLVFATHRTRDEGTHKGYASDVDYVGAGVAATHSGIRTTVTVAGTSPGGSDTQIQYNDNGSFAGIPGSSWDGSNVTLPPDVIVNPNAPATQVKLHLGSNFSTWFTEISTVAGSNAGNLQIAPATDLNLKMSDNAGANYVNFLDSDSNNVGNMDSNGNFQADGTVTGATILGANVTSGADPGHTHTGSSVSGFLIDAGTVVDNSIPAFDGTDGVTTQPTGVTIDDSDNIVTTGNATINDLIIGDARYIGSVSDTDAIQIEADGDVVFTQDIYLADDNWIGLGSPNNARLEFDATPSPDTLDVCDANLRVSGNTSFYIGGADGTAEIGRLFNSAGDLTFEGDGNRDVAFGSANHPKVLFINGLYEMVGINDTGPDKALEVLDDSGTQLRLTHTDGVDHCDFGVDGDGLLTITPSGNDVIMTGDLRLGTTTAGPRLYIYDTTTDKVKLEDDDGTTAVWGIGSSIVSMDISAGDDFRVRIDNDEKFRVTQGGNVGIGTTSPANTLHVNKAGDTPVYVGDSTNIAHGMTDLAPTDVYMVVDKWSGSKGGCSFRGLSETSDIGGFLFQGISGGAAPSVGVVTFRAGKANGTTWQNVTGTDVAFSFQNILGNVDYITVLGNGNVGMVGVTSPNDPLEVSGDINLTNATDNIQIANADPKKSFYVPATAMWPREDGNGCAAIAGTNLATNNITIQTLDFDASSDEFAQFNLIMPKNWDGTLTYHVVWTGASGAGGTVEWNLHGRSYADSEALDQALGTSVAVSDTLDTANDVQETSESGAVTITGATAGEYVHMEIWRDVSDDNLNADAKLKGIRGEYGLNQYNDT